MDLQDVMTELGTVFETYTKPAAAIQKAQDKDGYFMSMAWGRFGLTLEVTEVVEEVLSTGRLTKEGQFQAIVDQALYELAKEMVAKHEKLAAANNKRGRKALKLIHQGG
jgi:hypothetical protein